MQNGEQAAAAPAADSPSIEQRAAAIFGDAPVQKKQPVQAEVKAEPEQTDQAPNPESATTDTDAGDTSTESTAPQFEEVEYEGELYQVPPKLKEAIIRQSDYTKKTQEVAEQRKLVEHQQAQLRAAAMNQEFQQAIAPQLHEIAQIESQLAQYDKVNWREIPADDRTLHMLEMQRLEKLHAEKVKGIESKRSEHQQKFNEQLQKLQSEAAAVLKSRIPGWGDETAKGVREWALSNGFTQDEISSIHDPRHAEVLWKASQYDKARSNAKPAVQQAKAAKPTSSNPMPQQVKDKLAFHKQLNKTQPGSAERRRVVEGRAAKIFS
jgi:hypothetical protein